MFLLMGCDVNRQKYFDMYKEVFGKPSDPEPHLNLEEFARMIDYFVSEVDPVDGVISSI